MYGPPRYVGSHGGGGPRGGGGGGGGGFRPPNYQPYRQQNPRFPYFLNQQSAPAFPQHHFQNPNIPPLTHRPSHQNHSFPLLTPSPSPQVTAEMIEGAASKAHHDLLTAGESVSAWKVSQAAIVALKVDSWSSLGIQMQYVPYLHRLIVTEGKINAFIHCFVGARRITTLYELGEALCKSEGVGRFEELGLGPLLRHPLIEHYFCVPSDLTEILRITSEDIVAFLRFFMEKRKTKITPESFLDFLAEQKSVSAKEKLGVRIHSLGLHISYIREAKNAEENVLTVKHKVNKNCDTERRDPSQPPGMYVEKLELDERFDHISTRIKSFSSAWDDFGGKHIHFDSDDDLEVDHDDDDDEVDLDTCQHASSSRDRDSGQHVSSCPYPSTTEERARLRLSSERSQKSSAGKMLEIRSKKSSGKKRKCEDKSDSGSLRKLLKSEQLMDVQEKLRDLSLARMEKFITTWKEACREHPVAEVLAMMVNYYSRTDKHKKKIIKLFSSYPGVGLLNIAVTSIKRGMVDGLYDTFQAFDEHGLVSSGSGPSAEVLEIEPSAKGASHSNKVIDRFPISISVDDIVKKVAKYVESDPLLAGEKDVCRGKKLVYLKKLHDCEAWLTKEFSVNEFSSIGYENFFDFLEKHASLLPHKLLNFLNDKLCEPSVVEVSMLEHQLRLLLSQVESNMMGNTIITKTEFSTLLKKQFPTLTFHIVGYDFEKCFIDLIKKEKESYIDYSNCVLFSTTLLGKWWSGKSMVFGEKQPEAEAGQPFLFPTVSSKEAIECLLKAPMLSDLLSWSHWDAIFAPSLGPLFEWLLNEVHNKELLCIATVDGKLIRIEHSATVDEFLDAFIQCSSFQAAVKLLSLLALYKGTRNAPLSLLKCYAHRAIDVIIRNFLDSKGVDSGETQMMYKGSAQGHAILDKGFGRSTLSGEVTSSWKLCDDLSRINKANSVVSIFILECLGYLPREFWSFAADILVTALGSFTKDAPIILLNACGQTDHRLMLHDIGLSLGIMEWIDDYHKFLSSVETDLFTSLKTLNSKKSPCSELDMEHNEPPDASEITANKMLNNVKDVTFQVDRDHHTSDAASKIGNGDTKDNNNRETFDVDRRSEVCREVTKDFSGMFNDQQDDDAINIVESIRREEFGLDPNLNSSESCLLSKQHARLGRALHCLSQELYSQDSHLLLELVQNADDNIYPENVDPALVFILQDTGIIVLNNEQGFSAHNIRALCDIGNSTKKESNAGYIGHKGIGFKSVFRVTDAPEIHSNGFHVKFDISEGQIGFVLPTVVSSRDINMFRRMLSTEGDKSDCTPWNTCIFLPFKSKFRDGTGMNSIISMFSDLHPSLLLFLHRLNCIKFKNMLNGNLVVMRRETLGNGIVRVSHGEENLSWLVVSRKLQASVIRRDVGTTEIAMAFTLQETDDGDYNPHLSQQPVFSFLPLRNYGLKFILQGDFVLPSSREEVDGNSAWNQWLLSEFPDLFVSAEESFCSLPCFKKNLGKAVTAYMSFVPLAGEVHGFFSHIPRLIISKLRMSSCLLLDGPDSKWVLPCRVLRGWTEQARMLLSDNLLQQHLGLGYLSKDIVLSDSLAKSLGIQEYGPKVLIDIISSICHLDDGINSIDLDWISSWLGTLYSTLLTHSSGYNSVNAVMENDLIDSLRKIPFIPLSDGSYSSLANGPIWLPWEDFGTGFEGKHSPKDFPSLYAKLRIVNPLLFASGSMQVDNMQVARSDNLVEMLHKIGVQTLSPHDVIKNHMLAALPVDACNNEDKSLMIEYILFIFLHFQFACPSCNSGKADIISELRQKPIILTKTGYKCPDKEPIHFGKEYGNTVDIDRLIDMRNVQWFEVDAAYVKHSCTQSLSNGLIKWRTFFQELGVTDFLQVTRVNKSATDFLYGACGSMASNMDLTLLSPVISDWESPELVNLISSLSSRKKRAQCIYLMEILDRMWDETYGCKARLHVTSKINKEKRAFESSFLKCIRESQWIASSMDEELHHSTDLFYDSEEVRSVLGIMAPYAVPKVTSKLLLKDIGFKMQVSVKDALSILNSWRTSKAPFMASILQMSKLYTLIFEGVSKSEVKITEEFMASPFIFVPFLGASGHNVVPGMFVSHKEVYWHDPTGSINRTEEIFLLSNSPKKSSFPPCKALANVYPSLHDFFVNICGVDYLPPFRSYLQILLQLSNVALPSQSAHTVFQVFLKWADDLKSGLVKPEEVSDLKEELLKLENTVLPTLQDKWVSLHPSFGLICWCDDEELRVEFKHCNGIDFLQFGEITIEEKDLLVGKVANLFQNIGIPSLSEMVSREAIFYGTEDNMDKASLINWVIPYAQRYLVKIYPGVYLKLKQLGLEKITQIRVVVVEKLYYKHTLKGRDSTSKKRIECSCLLEGNVLYATRTSDPHSLFLELSRFFFSGSPELHLANFLHMVTTMAESGATNEQIEFFIVNSQKVPELPDDEPVWILSSILESHEGKASQPPLPSPMNTELSTSKVRKKPGISSNWPPSDWRNSPDFFCSRTKSLRTGTGLSPCNGLQNDISMPLEAGAYFGDLPQPVEIPGDWIIEDGLPSTNTLVLLDPQVTSDQPHDVQPFDTVDLQMGSGSRPGNESADLCMPSGQGIFPTDFPASADRKSQCLETPDENQLRKTGRLGEMIAHRYFTEKLGASNVKWVNQETETGLPYDLVMGEEESMEYIEVKSTRSSKKSWFDMSSREWEFATEMGDKFSIAHVVLLGPKQASVTLLRNPVKLCQKNILRIALLMSRQLREASSSVPR